jgi:hypothetical protein
MNNVIHAICAEKQASVVYLQRLQTFFDANEDYLSKVGIDFIYLKKIFD